jgi:hypothetical protein
VFDEESGGEEQFLAAMVSFFDPAWGEELAARTDCYKSLCGLTYNLDHERTEILCELLRNYQGCDAGACRKTVVVQRLPGPGSRRDRSQPGGLVIKCIPHRPGASTAAARRKRQKSVSRLSGKQRNVLFIIFTGSLFGVHEKPDDAMFSETARVRRMARPS